MSTTLWPETGGNQAELPVHRPLRGYWRAALGLEGAGGQCVYSVEIDKHAQKTYAANFGRIDDGDVRTVDPGCLPAYDVLAAGFPCQPFSIAGVSKKASLGREHGFADAKSGNLFFEIVRIAEATSRPSCSSRTSRTSGHTIADGPSRSSSRSSTGSDTKSSRRSWTPLPGCRSIASAPSSSVSVARSSADSGSCFRRLPAAPRGRSSGTSSSRGSTASTSSLRTSGQYLQAYAQKHREAGHGFGFGLVGGDDVARTLSARYYKDGSEILIDTAAALPRRLTPVECARLMGFPNPRTIDHQHWTGGTRTVLRDPGVRHAGVPAVRQLGRRAGRPTPRGRVGGPSHTQSYSRCGELTGGHGRRCPTSLIWRRAARMMSGVEGQGHCP